MGMDEPILTISIAAALLGIHPRTLMLYERAGFFTPHRTITQRRMYSKKNLDELQFIKFLTRDKGCNLQGVKIVVEAIKVASENGLDLKRRLFPNFRAKTLV